jgi:hypothetical protein
VNQGPTCLYADFGQKEPVEKLSSQKMLQPRVSLHILSTWHSFPTKLHPSFPTYEHIRGSQASVYQRTACLLTVMMEVL